MPSPRQFLTGIDLTSNQGINCASPTLATDIANKGYVDNLINGLSWKVDVRAATTTNGTLASSFANGSVIDGQTLATNDRILIKNQTTQTENGLYTVNATGAPTRSLDADATTELDNAVVSVLQGTVNQLTSWVQTTVNPTIGSSNIVWASYAVGQAYTAGNGLALSSGAFSVLLDGGANSGLAVSGSGTKVNPGAGIKTSGGTTAIDLNATNPALSTSGGLAVIPGTGITVAANTVAVDTTLVARKFATSIGDGTTTVYTVTHNLGTLDVGIQVFKNSTGTTVEADTIRTTTNACTVGFTVAPSTNAYRVCVTG